MYDKSLISCGSHTATGLPMRVKSNSGSRLGAHEELVQTDGGGVGSGRDLPWILSFRFRVGAALRELEEWPS